MFKANVKIGNTAIQIEAETIKELFREASFFTECPTECECSSKNIFMNHRTVQQNDFFELICGECERTFPIGQHKVGGSLFCNKSKGWQEPYRGSGRED